MMSGLAPTNMVGSSMTMPIMSNGVTSQMGLIGKIFAQDCNGQ